MIADGDWVESKDQDPNGQVRLTQLADVGDGEFRSRSDRWMNDEQALRLNVNYLQPGDLLMARMPDPLGRTCMVPENIGRAVTVVDVAIIRITRKDLNPKFVMWLLNSPGIRQQIEMLASGTTRRRITRKNLGTIDLPIPPIDEQNKIADAMEKQSSSLRRSLLQAAFTGQLTKEVASV
jgi:type I restriction enzyme S subunit